MATIFARLKAVGAFLHRILIVANTTVPLTPHSVSYTPGAWTFGDQTNWRPCPTSGTLTGIYRTTGNWVQTGPLTCNEARLFFGGSVTFNNTVTIVAGVGFKNQDLPTQSDTAFRGDGGSHAGTGGQPSGQHEIVPYSTVAGTMGQWPLYGEGGYDDNGNVTRGGFGGGGFYVETRGSVIFTSGAALNADGQNGVAQTTPSGAGAGGGIDIRAMGAIDCQSGSTFSAKGGIGGNGTTYAGRGGGGGFINFEALGGVTFNGTTTVTGGATGTGPSGGAGGNGVVNLGTVFTGPRMSGW